MAGTRRREAHLRQRQPRHQPKDHTPPLDNDELEHVLACYQALRTRRPELAQAQILQNVADELRRAKQTDEGERFYRDAIAGADATGADRRRLRAGGATR